MNKKSKPNLAFLLSTCNSRAPIEDTIDRRWDDIVVALANGHSRASIADALAEEGEKVGNRRSGFNTALHKVAKRRGFDLQSRKSAGNDDDEAVHADGGQPKPRPLSGGEAASPQNEHGRALPKAVGGTQRTQLSFADDRYPSDFGGQ